MMNEKRLIVPTEAKCNEVLVIRTPRKVSQILSFVQDSNSNLQIASEAPTDDYARFYFWYMTKYPRR
jgi:hypothetical protein